MKKFLSDGLIISFIAMTAFFILLNFFENSKNISIKLLQEDYNSMGYTTNKEGNKVARQWQNDSITYIFHKNIKD
ncbi:MAG: hypothetical protein Q4G27_06665 [Flavobacteriaceae bacterium]|nr:hypothetical protein [Flavobacteriaceae bacterium]